MAEVFLAKTSGYKGLERLVAIKRIHGHLAADRKFTSMLIDEANLAAKLTHANIAQIFDLGKVDGQYYIAMEYVHGRDLRAVFHHHQVLGTPVPTAQACYIGLRMCEGLEYAHNRRDYSGRELGLVHRDVSLNNLILSFDGELKLIDFGVAKAAGRSVHTEPGFIKGKIAYMSPEQLARRPLDRRSDVFACGIVLFEVLTGKSLFPETNLRELMQRVRDAAVPRLRDIRPKIPSELEEIVLKALRRDPDDRYASAGELHDALLDFVHRYGHHITRAQIASWMKELYHDHYYAESGHITALWQRNRQLDGDGDSTGGDRDSGAFSDVYEAMPDTVDSQIVTSVRFVEGEDVTTDLKAPASGSGARADLAGRLSTTMVGWAPASNRPVRAGPVATEGDNRDLDTDPCCPASRRDDQTGEEDGGEAGLG